MTSTDLEQRAERAVRRGELLVALEHFESYLAQQPDDERVRQRMESVRALLQPSELVSRRRAEPEPEEPGPNELSFAEQGEMHASSGRFEEAAEAYERALAAQPKNELLRERLEELRAILRPAGRADLQAGEKLEGGAMSLPPAARSARASEASFAPIPERKTPRLDTVAWLRQLLERVHRRRR